MKCIAYKDGYKYQLKEDYTLAIEIKPANPIDTDYIKLDLTGELTIKPGRSGRAKSRNPTFCKRYIVKGIGTAISVRLRLWPVT